MRKLVILTLIVILGFSTLGYSTNKVKLTTEEKNNGSRREDIVQNPFSPFTIQYPVDANNPDPQRDNKPFVEYDPEKGWTFYRVELEPGKTTDDHNRYRIVLSDTNEKIQLNHKKDDDYHQQLKMIFDDKTNFQANADFYSDKFSINHFCVPHTKSRCYPNNLVFQKCIRFTRKDSATYLGGAFTCSCYDNNKYLFSPSIGTIQIYDDNLQFEQWDVSHQYTTQDCYNLSKRIALNPGIHKPQGILGLSGFGGYLLGFDGVAVYQTTMKNHIVELFVDKNYFLFDSDIHNFINYDDKKSNYNGCRRYEDIIIIPIHMFSDIMGFKYSPYDPKTGKTLLTKCHSIEFPSQVYGENQILTFRNDSDIMELRYGQDVNLSIKVASTCPPSAPLFALLDAIPRYFGKGYKFRPMNDSILISLEFKDR